MVEAEVVDVVAEDEVAKAMMKSSSVGVKEKGTFHEAIIYADVHHGFAIRGNEDDPVEGAAKSKASADTVAFIKKFLV